MEEEIDYVIKLYHECRYLSAMNALLRMTEKVKENDHEKAIELQGLLSRFDCELKTLKERAAEIQSALDYEDDNSGWSLGATYFGINTYYRQPVGEKFITIKMEGTLDNLPLFEQCAVIHEVDLFKEWAPLCNESITVEAIGKAELVSYLRIGIPMLSRDMLLRAYGADCLVDHGKIVVVGKSISDYTEKTVPWVSPGWFHDKMYCKQFNVVIEVNSPTSAKTRVVTHLDPNCALPESLLNFAMKNLAGILLYVFQQQVVKVSQNPECSHADRIRSNTPVYRDWILPIVREFCNSQGWDHPIVTSLGADGVPNDTPAAY